MEAWKIELYYGSNELYHHGILGQKWGVRRFQNEDGTYTRDGKERRSIKKEERVQKKEAYKKRISDISNMSDSDLDSRINRLKKEQELKRLEKENTYPTNNGKKIVESILSDTGKQVATKLLTASLVALGSAAVVKIFKEPSKDTPNPFASALVSVLLANVKPKK